MQIPKPRRIEAGMAGLIVSVLFVLLVGAFAARVHRARAARRHRREKRGTNVSWATENTALRLLLSGDLGKNDYRHTVERIAAHDAVTRPLDLPLP
jgi:hypothetical protein